MCLIIPQKGEVGEFFGEGVEEREDILTVDIAEEIKIEQIFKTLFGDGTGFDFCEVQTRIGKPCKGTIERACCVREGKSKTDAVGVGCDVEGGGDADKTGSVFAV